MTAIKTRRNGITSDDSRAELERRALLSARLFADSMRSLYSELERVTDAPVSMHRALNAITAQPGLQASQLASRLGVSRPAASQLLRVLVSRGWAVRRRSDVDQRVVHIHLTAAGQKLVKSTSGRAVGALQRAVRGLSLADLERIAHAVPMLIERLPKRTARRPAA
ncbi:MAG: MarR family transcriptional regulator [Proteobacteria bacterium]|nr:MarR family transcriptional regulator [Pseudomonadota bacterium]